MGLIRSGFSEIFKKTFLKHQPLSIFSARQNHPHLNKNISPRFTSVGVDFVDLALGLGICILKIIPGDPEARASWTSVSIMVSSGVNPGFVEP